MVSNTIHLKIKYSLVSFLFLFSNELFCQTEAKNGETTQTKDESTLEAIGNSGKKAFEKTKNYANKEMESIKTSPKSKENRIEDPFHIVLEPLVFGIVYPVKSGISTNYFFTENQGLGFEYISGGYSLKLFDTDIATFSEKLLLVPYYHFLGTNSFYIKTGFGLRQYELTFGDDLLNTIAQASGNNTQIAFDLVKVKNEVVILGIGNQWQFQNGFTFGFDWIETFIPLGKGTVEDNVTSTLQGNSQENVRLIINYLERKPTFNLLKINLAWGF